MKIGFAGLGAMGGPMAGHLIDAGHTLYVLTRRRESANAAIAKGAIWAETPINSAANSDLVFTVLPGPPEIEADHGRRLRSARRLQIWHPLHRSLHQFADAVRQLSADLATAGVSMLDAPVSGGPQGRGFPKTCDLGQRREGDLRQLQADPRSARRPGALSRRQRQCFGRQTGPQLCQLRHPDGPAEAFTLGVKAGVDPVALFSAIRQGSLGRQRAVDRMTDQFLPHEFDNPAFALELAHKDVSLATALGRETGVPMRFANMTLAEYDGSLEQGMGQTRLALRDADLGRTCRPRHPRSPQRLAGYSQERAALISKIKNHAERQRRKP